MPMLIEGRGFCRYFGDDELHVNQDGSVRPKAHTWAAMRFVLVKSSLPKARVFASDQPAIGPKDGRVRDPFYQPGGWD